MELVNQFVGYIVDQLVIQFVSCLDRLAERERQTDRQVDDEWMDGCYIDRQILISDDIIAGCIYGTQIHCTAFY